MMKTWLLFAALLAILDPILLYLIYSYWGGWAAFGAFVGPIVLHGWISPWARRAGVVDVDDPAEAVAQAAMLPVWFAASFALWYPGPISSLLALLTLLPSVQKAIRRKVARQMMGGMTMFGGPGSFVMFQSSMGAGPQPAPHPGPGNLKRAEGTVVDDNGRLPPPEDDQSSSTDNPSGPTQP